MSWQLLIWNIFVWTFTGVMIYVTNSSLWWLLLPATFTGTQSASELVRAVNEAEKEQKKKDEEDFEVDEETMERMRALLEKAKRGSL